MDFNTVYRFLQEVFPKHDPRLLKSVALENPMDAVAAVEIILDIGCSSNRKSSRSYVVGKKIQVESTTDHVVVNPCVAEHSTKEHVSNIDGSFFGATEALGAGFPTQFSSHTFGGPTSFEPLTAMSFDHCANTETEANYDRVPLPLEETFGGSNSVNANSESVGNANVDNESLISLACKRLVGTSETNVAATQESNPSCSTKALEKNDSAVNVVNSEDVSAVLTRSEQVCSTEYLDEVIEDAKSKKQTLVLAMNSVTDLMKAVESKEKEDEQANVYGTQGCSDILAKVDELKYALLRAKEANDMHSGEVNAEKAILATELRELQLRLFTLSDERNKSLAILDEMHRALEIRMAAALEEIAAAEDKKLERERSAREALLYQESQMEKVVEESKKLKLEAEENSKLQEFLMDRGRTIDILQGEMTVKFQDVLLLKEKYDKRIPLSQSTSSSQLPSIVASPNSSFRSTTTPFEHETATPKKSSEEPDFYGVLAKNGPPKFPHIETVNSSNGEQKNGADGPLDDDDDDEWELFNNGEYFG